MTAITVPDGEWQGTVVAAVTDPVKAEWVFAQAWLEDGTYVYAAYFPIEAGLSTVGPLFSTLWPNLPANGKATAGWFRRRGFGRWVEEATADFSVKAK